MSDESAAAPRQPGRRTARKDRRAQASPAAAIAEVLTIGESTVKTHVPRILHKLLLRDRAHAVIYGYETGLVRPGEGTG